MNDDELTRELRAAMAERTAADRPSRELMHALATARVRGSRPYLVPFSAAAVVTALTTGGVLVSQAGGGLLTAGTTPTTPALPSTGPSAAVPAPAVPSAAPATSAAPSPSAAPATSASPAPAKTTASPAATTTPSPVAAVPSDDGALLAAAASYSVTSVFVPDAAHPAVGRTTHVETFPHDGTKTFFAGAEGLDWDQLAALPADQGAFAVKVKAPGAPPNPVEKGVQELYLEGPMPLPLRKNAVATLESAPGATTTEHSADHLGRSATKVRVTTDLLVDDYYFDPVSYRLLETGVAFSAAWKADYVAHAAVGAEPVSDFTTGYTDYSDWVITPKSS